MTVTHKTIVKVDNQSKFFSGITTHIVKINSNQKELIKKAQNPKLLNTLNRILSTRGLLSPKETKRLRELRNILEKC